VDLPAPGAGSRGASASSALRRWTALPDVVLFLAATLVYATALPNQFTQDDFYYFVESDDVLTRPWVLFLKPFRDSGIYRPLTLLTFGANHAAGGLEPIGFHLLNVILHGAVTLLVYRVLRQLADDRGPAAERDPRGRGRGAAFFGAPFAAALLFAVHPIHAEAVAAVVGRAELLSTGLVLGAWLLHLADRRGAAAASFFLALLAKEPAVAFLALAPLGDRVRGRPIRPSRYWPYAAAFAGYLVLRWLAVGAPAMDRLAELENPLLSLPQPWRALNALVVAWRYVVLQIFPATLSADYSFDSIPLTRSPGVLAAALAATLGALAAWAWSARRAPRAFLAGGIYLAGFAVTSNVLFLIPTILGERLAYLPSAGLCLLAGLAYERSAKQSRALAIAVLAVVASALALRTAVRNLDWHDNFTLAVATVSAYPDNVKMSRNLGVLLLDSGQLEAAREHLERAYRLDPGYPDLLDSLAVLRFRQGDLPGALRFAGEAVRASTAEHPRRADFTLNLAGFLIQGGRLDEALPLLDRLIAEGSPSARAFGNRAVLHLRRNELDAARADFREALRLDPSDAQAARLLAELDARATARGTGDSR